LRFLGLSDEGEGDDTEDAERGGADRVHELLSLFSHGSASAIAHRDGVVTMRARHRQFPEARHEQLQSRERLLALRLAQPGALSIQVDASIGVSPEELGGEPVCIEYRETAPRAAT